MADQVGRGGDETRAERRRDTRVERTPRPRMADVTSKPTVPQRAVAEAELTISQEAVSAIIDGQVTKGDVLSVAELAGVMAGKRASELIPLTHPVALTDLVVQATPERALPGLRVRAEAATTGQSGVEMQAFVAAAVAAMTAYDMIRDLDRGAFLGSVRLISSTSGSAEWRGSAGSERRVSSRAARGAGRVPRGSGAAAHAPRDGRRTPARGRHE